MERKQGIYVDGERVCAEASTPTVNIVDKVIRTVKGEAYLEVYSKGKRVRQTTYFLTGDGTHRSEGDRATMP